MHMVTLWKALESGNQEQSEQEYEAGLDWVRANEPDEEVFWKCFYQRRRFLHGNADALEELRKLAAEYATDYLPRSYLASCLVDLREYDQAVKYYFDAASLSASGQRAWLEISAAETLQQAKKPKQAEEVLLRIRDADYAKEGQTQFRILQSLYSLWKESEDKFAAFSIAELALHNRPEEMGFRFSLAFDYGDAAGQGHMSLYHYKIICDQDEKNAAALNNLGIALSNNELPILAVRRYKQSYKLGETLAASNLAHKYLDAGLSEEATAILKEAQGKHDCVPDVSGTLAVVQQKTQQNDRGQGKIVTQAEQNRNFLLAFATAHLSPLATNLQGRWSFPSGEIELQLNGTELQGNREDRSQSNSAFGSLLGTPKTITKIEKFSFLGSVSGRSCKFNIEITRTEEPSGWSFLGGPSDSKIEGCIAFAEDGRSGKAVEVKAGKPEKYYDVLKKA